MTKKDTENIIDVLVELEILLRPNKLQPRTQPLPAGNKEETTLPTETPDFPPAEEPLPLVDN